METSDTGAIYAGADITTLGNVIHHNYFHDLGSRNEKLMLVAGIYLDDNLGGVFIRDNIFVGTTWAGVVVNGGRDNTIENNIFIRCNAAVSANNGHPEWFRVPVNGCSTLLERLRAVPYTQPPWNERFPELAERMRSEWGEPWRAINNWVVRNICVDSPWTMNTLIYNFRDNWIMGPGQNQEVPLFRNPEHPEADGFTLHQDAPVLNLGFRPIPFDRIGSRT